VIAGLGMERDFDSLVSLYVAGLCGIGYGLRQIIETQSLSGASVERVVISGGAGASPFVQQSLADACGKPILAPVAEEPVLLGSAILASVAAGIYPDVDQAMHALSAVSSDWAPAQGTVADIHERRYQAFLRLQEVSRAIRSQ
jgi:D-ribulokinase